jgi:hypothetical protein
MRGVREKEKLTSFFSLFRKPEKCVCLDTPFFNPTKQGIRKTH